MTVVLRWNVISVAAISGVITATMSSGPSTRSMKFISGCRIVAEPSICV